MTTPTCEVAWRGTPDDFCGHLAVVQLTGGCVHEHITDHWVCDTHRTLSQTHDFLCRACWLDPDHSHRCLMQTREVTFT